MAPPFVQTTPAWVYVSIGVLATFAVLSVAYIIYLHRSRLGGTEDDSNEDQEKDDFRIDNMGLSKKAEDLLSQVMSQPELQNDLPGKLDVSKATVSNAVSELKERGLVIRKKKANTYLIEPDEEEIEKQQR